MIVKVFGIIYSLKKGWSILSYNKYILLVTNIGLVGIDLGPLYYGKKKIINILKMLIAAFMGYSMVGFYGALMTTGEISRRSIKEDVNKWLGPNKELDLDNLNRYMKIIVYPYQDIKKLSLNLEDKTLIIWRNIFRKNTFIVDPSIIEYIPRMFEDSGLNILKYEFGKGE